MARSAHTFSTRTGTARVGRLLGLLGLFLLLPLARGTASAQSLPNGGSVLGSISPPGDQDTYTFSANAGENIKLRVADLGATALYVRIELYDPSGVYVTAGAGQNVGAISATAASTGTYTVVVMDGNSIPDETGAYELFFVRVPGANEGGTLINGGSLSGLIDLGDLDSYTFDINAGENLKLRIADLGATGLYPRIDLYDPSGAYVTAGAGVNVGAISVTAAFTGTYTVIVSDGNSVPQQTGAYELFFVRVPGANEGGTLINGGSLSGLIDLGDLDSYTFDINAGENLKLRIADLGATGLYPRIDLYDPSGAYVTAGAGVNVGAISTTAAATGTYTVIVSDGNSVPQQTGAYELFFVRVPGANDGGTLVNGGSLSGLIDLGDLDSYTFDINAGENLMLRIADLGATGLYPRMDLYDPSGAYVTAGAGVNVGAISTTAAATGTYTVVVSDGNSIPQQTGSYELYFVRVPGANEGGLLLDGVTVFDVIDLGDLDSFTFLAGPGEMAQITLTDLAPGALYPRVTLYDPAGAYITAAAGPLTAVLAHTIVGGGTYTVVVGDGNSIPSATGPYSIVLNGSGANPPHPTNVICPAEFPTDPILADNGGSPSIGPKIGDPAEPFNLALDCTGASAPSFLVMQLWSSKFPGPLLTQWGNWYAAGSTILSHVAFHTQSVESWYPAPSGLVFPNDPALVGFAYTVQGFAGGFGPNGRLSNAILQTIGD